jgi:hypothetical protein
MKAFGWREFEGPQGMVHVAWIQSWVPNGNRMGLTPPRLTAEKPFVLARRHIPGSRRVVLHDNRMMPQM